MGRNNKYYHKDLKQQISERFQEMLSEGVGTSKKESVKAGDASRKIFSFSTYQTYRKHCNYFATYVRTNHPECTTLKKARKYVNEWLLFRSNQTNSVGEPLSAWTIQTEAKALNKLFGITPDDPEYFEPPKRKRVDIKRSRGNAKRDAHFSEANHDEFVKFCRGTGCRRNIAEKLIGEDFYSREEMEDLYDGIIEEPALYVEEYGQECIDLYRGLLKDALDCFPDQDYFVFHYKDKGGRCRYAPIIGPDKGKIIERFRNTKKDEKVWLDVPENADVHGYRGEYATAVYKLYARPIEDIPFDKVNKGTGRKYQSGVYVCRKDEAGKKLDKLAMEKVSKALGHNRLEIVANNYIRGL